MDTSKVIELGNVSEETKGGVGIVENIQHLTPGTPV
jgi:hypothetical protein